MEFKDLIKLRQSDRAYENKDVETEKINQILEAGRLSPSACNAQGWTFVVVNDEEIKKALVATIDRMGGAFVKQAPVVIAVVSEKPLLMARFVSFIKKLDLLAIDIGITAAHICLQAADLGLGSCMIESFDEAKAKKVLNIPDNRRLALLITLGYSADKQRVKRRKDLNEVVHWNSY